jgi:fumarylacetoacetase
MMPAINATHDAALGSWVASANRVDGDFPIQNLPFGVFRRRGSDEDFRAGVAIGDQILDLREVYRRRLLPAIDAATLLACCEPTLNRLMAAGPAVAGPLRAALSKALASDSRDAPALAGALVAQAEADYALPAQIGDYTDFYSSIHHARTVGAQFRPEQPLLPNYQWIPIAYHGRSSSIGVSEQEFARPVGQSLPRGAATPSVGPSRRLDFELEMGIFIGCGNALGHAIDIAEAESHVFGLCLLNDWSARDLQGWEYQPLGPFLGKNFATTISPWVVTLEALAPYRLPFCRPAGDPQPLAYLDGAANRHSGVLDIELEVALQTAGMRSRDRPPRVLARSNLRHAYWTIAQMLAHHTVNGCNLRPGDLLGTGTLSGPEPGEAGSLLELTDGGRRPLVLEDGETRGFLEDGDRVVLRAWCERPGCARLGFGTAAGIIAAARAPAHPESPAPAPHL